MSKITGEIYPSSTFTWEPKTRSFVGEMSAVRGCLRHLFQDDIVCGFGIQSVKTGRTALFTLESIERDQEGDIVFWQFIIHGEEGNPNLEGITAIVFNT